MNKITIHLPAKRETILKLIKNRLANHDTPLLPKPGGIWCVKSGSKISGVFRRIFENRKIQKVLGLNLAALFLSTSLMQFPFEETTVPDEEFVTKVPFVMETKKSIQYPVEVVKITQVYKTFHPGIDLD